MLIHYGKHFDNIAFLYDHSTDTHVWAHNLVNLHYSDDDVDYPGLFELWQPLEVEKLATALRSIGAIKPKKELLKEDYPSKWKKHLLYLSKKHKDQQVVQEAYRSKLIIGQDLLRDFFKQYPALNIAVSFDKWFTNPGFCKFIDKELNKAYVAGLTQLAD